MNKAFWWLFGLGVADLVVWWVPLLWTNLWMNFGMCIANLVVIVAVLVTAQPHLDVGRAEMSEYERKRASGVLKGLMIIMLVPIHEVLGWLPLGYYSPSWSSYGWLGLLNPAAMLLGAMVVAFNVQRSRERMGYFAIWRNGVIILVLAPCFALIQLAVPILVYPEWFHQTVGLMGGTVMVIAFVLKRQRDRQLSELETAMRRGDELAARGQLEQAIDQYDMAINMAHTLFSHLIFNPDSPSMSVRVPPAYSEPWFRKGRVLVRRGRPDKALAIFEMIIEMDPSNQIALLNASEVMVAMGDFKGALAAVDRVLRIVPGHPDALRMKTAIEEAARKAAEDEERAQAAETVFVSAPARPPPVAPAEGEFLDA
jgi:tetratricopeptide (TPR) repeat protein